MTNMNLKFGDALERMAELEAESVDLVLTDPPYGTTACAWDTIIPLEDMWAQLERVIKPGGAIVLTSTQPFTTKLIGSRMKLFKYQWIWEKPQGVDPFLCKIRPMNNIEDVLVFAHGKAPYFPQFEKGDPYTTTRDKNSNRVMETFGRPMKQTTTINKGVRYPKRILKFTPERGLHPTQKPVALMEYLIKTYTLPGETVLDFAMGSGTTGVACAKNERHFIGIELDINHFNTAKERIKLCMRK